MCTSIIEIVAADGAAKRGNSWFPLTTAVVAYDHARHAPLGDVITQRCCFWPGWACEPVRWCTCAWKTLTGATVKS